VRVGPFALVTVLLAGPPVCGQALSPSQSAPVSPRGLHSPRRHLGRAAAAPDVVATDAGQVRGAVAAGTVAFLGIPFAAPPVGSLRWRPPALPATWSGVRDALTFAPPCPQLDDANAVVGSEDCLYLNLWAPVDSLPSSALPVLLFIHGGGHVQGSTSSQLADGTHLYDGAGLAARAQAVVVTSAYRLGVLGFLNHPALAAESPEGSAGNYGIRDLVAALGWVQRNVSHFGGDPGRVLVFGESAGAVETCMLLVSPLAVGRFAAALMESGGCSARARSDAEAFGEQLVGAASCAGAADVPACLRGLSAATLVNAIPATASVVGAQSGYQPSVDGVVIPEPPMERLEAGRHNHVPLVVGANADETGRSVPIVMTEAEYEAAVRALLGGNQALTNLVLLRYPVSAYGGSARQAYVAVTSDSKFICTARRVARAAAHGQTEPVFRYFFTHPFSNGSSLLRTFGAYHGIELMYVFDRLDALGYSPTAGEIDLGEAVVSYWRTLAATGDANGASLPVWPLFDPVTDTFLQLDDPITAGSGVRTAQCDFWDSLSP
jgi:para-nitrobenzyl esterase